MEPMRIQKWLSQIGIASRREAESWIAEGRISVNGQVVREPGTKITPGVDKIEVDGRPVGDEAPARVYWLLHKPDECLTVRGDTFERPSIHDLPAVAKAPFMVHPVGSMDFRTEGILIVTNDGDLIKGLTRPHLRFPRTYHVLASTRLPDAAETAIRKGMVKLEDGVVGPCELRFVHGRDMGGSRGFWYVLTVNESRQHLVRRIFELYGAKVVKLMRVQYAGIDLPESLKPGDYRQLTSTEVQSLKKLIS